MFQSIMHELSHLLTLYGYLAVLVFVAIESTGIPFPGETMLLTAAVYAGTTHRLAIPLVILAAAVGAILGDNFGFLIGREGGFRLVRRYGHLIHLDEGKLKLAVYLFRRHGGKVVFFGRFVSVLRAWAAFLAGTSRMPWRSFLLYNAAGGIVWATLYGLAGYIFGANVERFTGLLGNILLGVVVLGIVAGIVLVWHRMRQMEDEAERALPGPLDQYIGWRTENAPTDTTSPTSPASATPAKNAGDHDGAHPTALPDATHAADGGAPPIPEHQARE